MNEAQKEKLEKLMKFLDDHPEELDAALAFVIGMLSIEKIRAVIAKTRAEKGDKAADDMAAICFRPRLISEAQPIPALRPNRPRRA